MKKIIFLSVLLLFSCAKEETPCPGNSSSLVDMFNQAGTTPEEITIISFSIVGTDGHTEKETFAVESVTNYLPDSLVYAFVGGEVILREATSFEDIVFVAVNVGECFPISPVSKSLLGFPGEVTAIDLIP